MTAIESGSLKPTRALSQGAGEKEDVYRHVHVGSLLLTGQVVKVWLLVELIEDGAGPELDLVCGQYCYSILGQFAREGRPPVVVLESRDSRSEVAWCDQVWMGLVQRLAELALGGRHERSSADGSRQSRSVTECREWPWAV